MNKKIEFLLLTPLLFTSLTACHVGKYNLTFGTYLNQNLETLQELSLSELEDVTARNEVFLLATYQKDYSEDCLCWSTYQNVIVSYMNTYHEKVYLFDMSSADGFVKSGMHIKEYKDSTPALYIFEGKSQIAGFSYKNQNELDIFEDLSGKTMYEKVHEKVNKPVMYEVNDQYLSENLSKKEEALVFFMRNGCGDCSYVLPNIIIPYITTCKTKKEMLVFDMESIYQASKLETPAEGEKTQYELLKDKYGLSASANPTYGYINGVVPTIQHYKNGIVDDATVYFNDVISEKEGGVFYLSDSYYSEERIPNLKYYNGRVLKGMVINEAIKTASGYTYWSQQEASKYHSPILESFLKYYL